MTLIVASLTDAHPEVAARTSAETDADVVEVRFDLLRAPSRDDAAFLAKALARPALATVRLPKDGGRWTGPESGRQALLEAAVDAGFAFVDVEDDAPFADALLARAARKGVHVVLSRHDLAATPPPAEALAFFRDAAARGAWCAKLATTLATPRDAVALVEAAALARAEGLRFAVMAVNDAALRCLAPALGSALAYGSAGAPAAPGQVPAPVLRRVHALQPPALAGASRLVVLLGDPVSHSRSPAFQNAGFRATGAADAYVAWRVAPADLPHAVSALRAERFLGANVTVPHKAAVVPFLDDLAPAAADVGAVNTVVRDGGRLVGHNTDGEGAMRALRDAGVEVRGAVALLLGAGGAARAVAKALLDAGADVTVANRTPGRAAALAEATRARTAPWGDREALAARAGLVVNCTTLGLQEGEAPLPAETLRPGSALLDATYRPGGTDLARAASRRGVTVVPGEAMLLHQGAAAFELWTRGPAPLPAMRAALAASLEATP